MFRALVSMCLILVSLANLFDGFTVFWSSGGVVYVPLNYTTIQEAVDHVEPGSVIYVREGFYNESLRLHNIKNVSIIGLGRVVLSSPTGSVDVFNSTNILFRNIVLANALLNISNSFNISLDNITIDYSMIKDLALIRITWSRYVSFNNTRIYGDRNVEHRVFGFDKGLILISSCENIVFRFNDIRAGVSIYGSNNVAFYGNNIYGNIELMFSDQVTFNSPKPMYYRYGNKTHYNRVGNFYGTELQDRDNDGIGDYPYPLGGGFNVLDFRPLVRPIENYVFLGDLNDLVNIVEPKPLSHISKLLKLHISLNKNAGETQLNVDLVNGFNKYNLLNTTICGGEHVFNISIENIRDGYYILKITVGYLVEKPPSIEIPVYVDNTPPRISLTGLENNTVVYSGRVEIRWGIEESYIEEEILYLDGEVLNISEPNKYVLDIDKLDVGKHNLTIYVRDKAGNIGTLTIVFTKEKPALELLETRLVVVYMIILIGGFFTIYSIYRRKTSQTIATKQYKENYSGDAKQ